jgi:flagellar biosynthesis/type III secretory pathway M-ring protein FliF/YscJ
MDTLLAGIFVGVVAFFLYRPVAAPAHERKEQPKDDVDVKTMTPHAFQVGRTNKNPFLYRTEKL